MDFLRHYLPWLAPILVFGLVIFVHEFGHFAAAKLTGVYAPRFSIGFGPALWSHRWGETEYRISAFPLGGYVRMASREDEAVAMFEGGTEEGAATASGGDPDLLMPFGSRPIPPDRWFESKPLVARLFIMLAGVSMNAILALALVTGIALYFGRPTASNAPVIDRVLAGSPAAAGGLLVGDSVESVGAAPVRSWTDLVALISSAPGSPLAVRVSRDGVEHTLTITPRATPDTNRETAQIRTVGRIGAGQRLDRHPLPVGQAVGQAWAITWEMVGEVVHVLRELATGQASFSSLQGPLGIGKMSVDAARNGAEDLMVLIAFLSINVAVFNLLPIPILDGGQIVVTVLESIKGRPFSLQTRENILRVGLVAIGLLFVLVMFNDRCHVFSALC